MKKVPSYITLGLASIIIITACQKMERPALGDYPSDTPVTPTTALRFYVPFDSMSTEAGTKMSYRFADSISKNPSFPVNKDIGYVTGIRGTAYDGVSGAAIKYVNANDLKAATSFSIAMWVKQSAEAASGRTEFYFSLVDDTYGWSHSALFMLVEHATPEAVTLKVGLMDQWLEFPQSNQFKKPLLDGNWHHFVITYDETTSKLAYYFDGAVVPTPPSSATDVKKDGSPRGKLDFSKSSYFVIGGWNFHASLVGPTDDWIKSYTGALDQFRIYNRPLTVAEIADLFTTKK